MALKDKDKIGFLSDEGLVNYEGNNPVDLYGSNPLLGSGTTITKGQPGSSGGNGTVYDDAMAKALREQNYKSYFETAIQNYNMKANSEKYLANELAAKGLGTQGYGSSAAAGVQNTAMNMYSQNLDNYNKTEQEITMGNYERAEREKLESEQKQTELDNQVVGFIQNAITYGADKDAINGLLSNYGYMEKDANGNYVFTDKWESLSDESKAYISSVIDSKDFVDDPNADMPTYGTEYNYDKGKNISGYDADGNLVKRKGWFNDENSYMNTAIEKGEVKPGTYIALVNSKGERLYIYYGTDGKMYNMSHEEYYKNATNENSVYFQYNKNGNKTSNAQSGVYK